MYWICGAQQAASRRPSSVRRLQYSLRSILILMTALAVWLSWQAHRARVQCEVTQHIETLGGTVQYNRDLRVERPCTDGVLLKAIRWSRLENLIGADYFREIRTVRLRSYVWEVRWKRDGDQQRFLGSKLKPFDSNHKPDECVKSLIPQLRRLPGLETIYLQNAPKDRPAESLWFSDQLLSELRSALPHCDVVRGGGAQFGFGHDVYRDRRRRRLTHCVRAARPAGCFTFPP